MRNWEVEGGGGGEELRAEEINTGMLISVSDRVVR